MAKASTTALGNAQMELNLKKGNANGLLDSAELPFLDAAMRTKVAGPRPSGGPRHDGTRPGEEVGQRVASLRGGGPSSG
jgi:hypothetical protein